MAQGRVPSSCDRAVIAATVTDNTGSPLTSLSASNFRAELQGKPVQVISAERKLNPAIVLFLDASGSMISRPRAWTVAVKVSTALIESVPPDTPVLLVLFANGPAAVQQGRPAVLSALKAMETGTPGFAKPDRRTDVTDTISASLGNMKPWPGGTIGYIVTDGGQNQEHDNVDHVIDAVVRSSVRLFTLLIPATPPLTEEEWDGPVLMQKLSEETGGTILVFHQWDDIRRAEQQFPQITDFYEIELAPPQALPKRTSLKLEVVDSSGHRKRSVQISYPHHLPACSALPAASDNATSHQSN